MIQKLESGNCLETHSIFYCVTCDICGSRPDSQNEDTTLDEETAYAVAEEDGWKTNFNGSGWDYCNECFKTINGRYL